MIIVSISLHSNQESCARRILEDGIMLRHFLFWMCLGFSSSLCAEPSAPALEPEVKSVPFNISLLGPISVQNVSYEKRDNYLCIGILHCGSRDLKGLGLSLASNTSSRDLKGVDIALGGNIVSGSGRGVMASFLFNWSGGDYIGLQLSSLNIIAGDDFKGAQVGFLANYASARTSGLQASFLLNILSRPDAEQVQSEATDDQHDEKDTISTVDDQSLALQFGLVNYSEQERTIPIGLINFVRGGRFDLGLSNSVFGYNRTDLAMGSEYFYTLLGFVSTGLNAHKSPTFHPSANGGVYSGFGLALPLVFLPHTFAKFEYFSSYAPTYYKADDGILRRLVIEYKLNPYFKLSGGVEHFSFHYGRHSRALRDETSTYEFTAGAAFNLLGWWR